MRWTRSSSRRARLPSDVRRCASPCSVSRPWTLTVDLVQEAEKAEHAAMQLIAEQQANMVPVAEAPVPVVAAGEVPMDVDSGPSTSAGTKRKAEEDASVGDASKKAKTGTFRARLYMLRPIDVCAQTKSLFRSNGMLQSRCER